MLIEISEKVGYASIRLIGEFTLESCDEFKRVIKRLSDNSVNTVINMQELVYLNSSALGLIVDLYLSLKRKGCEMRIVHMHENIEKLFSITRLNEIIQVCDNEQDAVNSFKKTIK